MSEKEPAANADEDLNLNEDTPDTDFSLVDDSPPSESDKKDDSTSPGLKKRFSKLTKRAKDSERRANDVEKENASLRQQLGAKAAPEGDTLGEYGLEDDGDKVNKALNARFDNFERKMELKDQETNHRKARRSFDDKVTDLKVSNFDESEENVREMFDDVFVDELIATIPDSPHLIYALGLPANRVALEDLRETFEESTTKGTLEIGRLLQKLKGKSTGRKQRLPDPDEALDGGGSPNNFEARLDKKRQDCADGKISMQQLVDWKAENRPKP